MLCKEGRASLWLWVIKWILVPKHNTVIFIITTTNIRKTQNPGYDCCLINSVTPGLLSFFYCMFFFLLLLQIQSFCCFSLKFKVTSEKAERGGLLLLMSFPVYGTLTLNIKTYHSKCELNIQTLITWLDMRERNMLNSSLPPGLSLCLGVLNDLD